ncbi:AraC family transcriptional regulator [Dactylosporangium sp. NPDC049525]|uniref:AraC family transcriptional regulator n=1 Tax=Dactylosporangium sp. NPDC049525 TaxID=3154730 RepID=UPI00341EDE8D
MRPSLEHVPSSPYQSWHLGVRAEPRFAFDWHYHPEYELTLIVAGSGRRYVGDRVADYGPGDLVLVGAQTPHTWASGPAGRHEAVTLQFQHDAFGAGFFGRPEFHRVQQLLARSAFGLRFGAGAVAAAATMVDIGGLDPARRTLALLDILVSLADQPAERLATHSLMTRVDAAARGRIDRVIGMIRRDYAEEVTVRQAASLIAMTPDAFSRFFRRHTGRTFTDYVNDVRLIEASRRLVESDTAISEIAIACGYPNLSHFNRRFRAQTGMSPREFRRHFRTEGRPAS